MKEGSLENSQVVVTVALQFFVEDSQLHLPTGSKKHLLGFCDPRLGGEESPLQNQLQIRYSFGGFVYEICVGDDQAVMLPSSKAVMLGQTDSVF